MKNRDSDYNLRKHLAEAAVAAAAAKGVEVHPVRVQLQDGGGHRLQERAVVGDQHQAAAGRPQPPLRPLDRLPGQNNGLTAGSSTQRVPECCGSLLYAAMQGDCLLGACTGRCEVSEDTVRHHRKVQPAGRGGWWARPG